MIPTSHVLFLSSTLLALGLYGVLTRRNAIAIFLAIELILNAANINLVAFGRQLDPTTGQVTAIFVIALAAAEAVVGLAIVLALFRHSRTVFTDQMNLLKG